MAQRVENIYSIMHRQTNSGMIPQTAGVVQNDRRIRSLNTEAIAANSRLTPPLKLFHINSATPPPGPPSSTRARLSLCRTRPLKPLARD